VSTAAVVGSGPNGLAAAITLADAGLQVTVYESEERIGGGTRSSELTLPGLIHDECSAAHPFAVDNPFSRRFDLREDGLRWRWPEIQFAHPLDGGRGSAAYRSVAETADALPGGDGRRWRAVFGWLAERFGDVAVDTLAPVLHPPRHPLLLARFGAPSLLPATVLGRLWRSEEGRALFGGVSAHAFRPLDSPMSASVGLMLGGAAHAYGWPVAEGGSRAIADAMAARLRRLGGRIETGRRVTALGELGSPDVVALDTAPGAAADICGAALPERVARAYRRFRHGPAAFKVEFAVEGGVPWTHEPSRRAGTIHVGGTLAEIADAEGATNRGEMPARPFLLVCQQYLADPTRSADDLHPVYSYAHVPAGYRGDATAAIEAQIERFAPGYRARIRARHVKDVTQMEADNANYVLGDIATGANDPRQIIFRPRVTLDPYATGIPGVVLCSAATPPGAGAHGLCGWGAAHSALRALQRA
jgi:phytoene dehydrogenase-like protein